jgi:hypothetical protein
MQCLGAATNDTFPMLSVHETLGQPCISDAGEIGPFVAANEPN